MKIFVVAGELSGDIHAAALVRRLKMHRPDIEIIAFGGSHLREAGADVLEDPTHLSVIGIAEAIQHLPAFFRLFRRACQVLDHHRPHLVVLVDYPGFNLRLAKEVKRRGIHLVYYIGPQVWAWNPHRIRTIRRLVDRMIVILPFEKALYERHGVPVTFVGHPLLDWVQPKRSRLEILDELGLSDGLPIVGLLPGSRQTEVKRILPTLLAACQRLEEALPSTCRFLLLKAPHLPWTLYRDILSRFALHPKILERWDYDGLQACDIVLVASGTATLECALVKRPMVIVYKTSWITYGLARWLLRIPAIGLVNIVAGQKIVPELIQHRATPKTIAKEALALWSSFAKRQAMQQAFEKVREALGEPNAVDRAALAVLEELNSDLRPTLP